VYGSSLELGGITYRPSPRWTVGRVERRRAGPVTANLRQSEYLAALLEGWPAANRLGLPGATAELMAQLRGIRGVGEFTASGIALRVFGRLDVAPAELPVFNPGDRGALRPGVSMADLAER